jgi:hypothetical protein
MAICLGSPIAGYARSHFGTPLTASLAIRPSVMWSLAEFAGGRDCAGRPLPSGGRGRRFKSSHSDQHSSTFSAAYGGIDEKFEEGRFSAEALRKPAAENSI